MCVPRGDLLHLAVSQSRWRQLTGKDCQPVGIAFICFPHIATAKRKARDPAGGAIDRIPLGTTAEKE